MELMRQLGKRDEAAMTTCIARLPPVPFLRSLRDRRRGAMGARVSFTSEGCEVIVHPWPFGSLENELLRRVLVERVHTNPLPWVLWISDPKSAGAFARLRQLPAGRLVRVFDAYDAWDLSPLVRGRWRRRAVVKGYQAAARHADLVFANTAFMAERMRALGAKIVTVLPNAAPVPPRLQDTRDASGRDPYLLYVGRIHERLSVELLAAVADAFPNVRIRFVGPVERQPEGWTTLVARPNVRLEGPMVGAQLWPVLANAAALLLAHQVGDYTLSQDAMKAWDALVVGTPVVGTPVPPVDRWPSGLAVVAADATAFVAGVRSALRGELEAHRAARQSFALANGWDARGREAVRAIEEVLTT